MAHGLGYALPPSAQRNGPAYPQGALAPAKARVGRPATRSCSQALLVRNSAVGQTVFPESTFRAASGRVRTWHLIRRAGILIHGVVTKAEPQELVTGPQGTPGSRIGSEWDPAGLRAGPKMQGQSYEEVFDRTSIRILRNVTKFLASNNGVCNFVGLPSFYAHG